MRRAAILLGLLLLAVPAWSTETLYMRSASGDACGVGDDETLNSSAGSSATTKTLDITGDNFDIVEARIIAAGDWQVCTDLTLDSGGGPANHILWLVQHFNSACAQQGSDIINEESGTITEGASAEYCSATANPGQITFASGDLIVVTLFHEQGNQTMLLDYEGAAPGAADSRLTHPDEYVAPTRSRVVDIQ